MGISLARLHDASECIWWIVREIVHMTELCEVFLCENRIGVVFLCVVTKVKGMVLMQ